VVYFQVNLCYLHKELLKTVVPPLFVPLFVFSHSQHRKYSLVRRQHRNYISRGQFSTFFLFCCVFFCGIFFCVFFFFRFFVGYLTTHKERRFLLFAGFPVALVSLAYLCACWSEAGNLLLYNKCQDIKIIIMLVPFMIMV